MKTEFRLLEDVLSLYVRFVAGTHEIKYLNSAE
jgi:hypothetical protein